MRAYLPIASCLDCPHKKSTNFYSTDGWDRMEDWICTKSSNRKIAGAVEWHEERKIKIPNWCPLLKKDDDDEISNFEEWKEEI